MIQSPLTAFRRSSRSRGRCRRWKAPATARAQGDRSCMCETMVLAWWNDRARCRFSRVGVSFPRNVDSSPAKHPINGVGGAPFYCGSDKGGRWRCFGYGPGGQHRNRGTDDRAISAACWLPSLGRCLIIDGSLGKLGQAFVGFLLFGQGLVEQLRGLRVVELERPGLQGAVA